jgi:glycosyltransferase involved in cell wall biosynthesis
MRLVDFLAHAIMFDGEGLVELHGGRRAVHAPIFIYYPPVPTDLYSPNRDCAESTRREYGIPLEPPVVGTVANLNPQKGIEHFIRAAAIIHRRCPDAWYLIVGETYRTHTRYRALLDAELAASGIPKGRVVFAGGTDSPERFYPAMNVKVITSLPNSEGTTTTALEAMACGVPVVSTDVGAVREVVPDGLAGFLVPPLRPEAIADYVVRLLRDDHLRTRLADTAREIAVARYGVLSCADDHVAAFEAALARQRAH